MDKHRRHRNIYLKMSDASFSFKGLFVGNSYPCSIKGHNHPTQRGAEQCNAHELKIKEECTRQARAKANPYNCIKGCGHPTPASAENCDKLYAFEKVTESGLIGKGETTYPFLASYSMKAIGFYPDEEIDPKIQDLPRRFITKKNR